MAQTLGEIKSLLATHGLHPKHRFGQNFLHDAAHMQRIIDAAAIAPGELVLEVGPGTGALTERLLEAGANIVAVEVDNDLEPILRHRLATFEDRVTLVFTDVLSGKHEIEPRVIEAVRARGGRFKLIANLPYNVASPLIANLVIDHPDMVQAIVMVQREVAERLIAGPGGKDYGPLGIIVQAMCHVEKVTRLSPGCFWPAPKVESMVVMLTRRDQPLTDDPALLSALLRKLFSKRRKQIGSILGRDRALPQGISPDARPEQLSLEQLIALSRCI